jgi:methanesulfonate monooxygenase small subunit
MSANGYAASEAVKDTIYRSCLLLDEEKWSEWLKLCDDGFKYSIKAWSPEINYDMTYFSADHNHLTTMTEQLPKHNTDHSPLKRHSTVYTVDVDEDGKTATAITSLVVYQNMLDGEMSHLDSGENRLFLVGKKVDKLSKSKQKLQKAEQN